MVQDFSKDRSLVSKTIETATASDRLGSGTFLGPALDEAVAHMQIAPASSRRVIIIITDNIATSFEMEKRIEEKLLDRRHSGLGSDRPRRDWKSIQHRLARPD